MKYRTSTEIRQLFLEFFVTKGHVIEPSSPLVPKDDPTLLWINSGVAALKKYFDGSVTPKSRRITNAQKSLRANDIENVGVTARHHTFFEMLGNFSIGDYFRAEAISYAWEFLTSEEWVGFDPTKLYVTVYPTDKESYNYWKETIGLPEDHIVLCEDNFWEIGEGPCGPCTEIFYDRGELYNYDTPKEELVVAGENDRYIEIWNVVFSQYNAQAGQSREEYEELPAKNIDTGMGLERMVSIIQDGKTNFETDLFLPIIATIENEANIKYATATPEQQTAFKLIADHTRAIVFATADGALPSNEGRGYVIRRLLRRASRFAKKLGVNDVFLYKLVPVVIEIMKGYYGYLVEKQTIIEQVIKVEEQKFLITLAEGEKKLAELLTEANNKVLAGEYAFMLYDTYGFPIELTIEMAAELGFSVDEDGFATYMKEQKERARAARHTTESMNSQNELLQAFTKPSEFVGYAFLESEVAPILIAQGDQEVTELIAGDTATIILDRTPFYAESGGQVSDKGYLINENAKITIHDVKKAPNGQHLHFVTVDSGFINYKSKFIAYVDNAERKATERNHTATHLLQYALRKTLGSHIEQAGSSVDSERLRFDFSHFEAINQETLDKIEVEVNQMIWQSVDVSTTIMPIEQAKSLGAMALFGEKYGDEVRVVQAGKSIELCGGTHVKNTSAIGAFKILSESGIGSGVRRIEAITSKAVYDYLQTDIAIIDSLQNILKKKQKADLVVAVENLLEDNKALTHTIQQNNKKMAGSIIDKAISAPVQINNNTIIFAQFDGVSIQELKQNVDLIKERLTDYIAVLTSNENGKTNIVVAVSKTQTDNMKSNEVIKQFNNILQSRGGGKPEIAQATVEKIVSSETLQKILQEM